nr:MAG TPA: Dicer [Caudoviricetes sp.]
MRNNIEIIFKYVDKESRKECEKRFNNYDEFGLWCANNILDIEPKDLIIEED